MLVAETVDASGTRSSRIDALDGLRAVAILAVLLYHFDVPWARGGFLGVSLFFTLSGFLITRLLLDEHSASGRISLRVFYARRFRRLAPAAVIVLIGISAVLVVDGLWTAGRRADLVAGLTYSANWHLVAGGGGYGSFFGMPSPFLHFWSLAIEEQFYVLFPLVALVALRRSRRALATVTAIGLVAAWAAGQVGPVAGRYFRTDVRALELLAGCLLALMMANRPSRAPRRVPGLLVLTMFIALAATTTVEDGRLYSVVLPGVAVLSCLLIVSAVRPGTRLARLMSRRPLVVIGRLSYAIYLVHWPIDVLVADTGQRLMLTAVLAAAVHLVVERPTARLRPLLAVTPVVALSGLVLVGCGLQGAGLSPPTAGLPPLPDTATPTPRSPTTASSAVAPTAQSSSVAATPATTGAPPPMSVLVVGDSTGEFLGDALARRPELRVTNASRRGCPLLDVDDVPVQLRRSGDFEPWTQQTGENTDCNWTHYLPEVPTGFDVAVVVAGPTMTPTYRLAPGDEVHVGEPEADSWMGASLTRLAAELARHASRTVWLTAPPSEATYGVGAKDDWYWTSPERADAWNSLQETVAGQTGGGVVDFARWFSEQPDRDTYRPDGAHLEGRGADLAAAFVTSNLQAAP
jgi:peptidoglycan/LPS O-acetylase OafA/YrhL